MPNRFQTFFSSLADRVDPSRNERIAALEHAVEVAVRNYNDGPLVLTRDNILANLSEAGFDRNILLDLLDSTQWEVIGQEYSFSDAQRIRAMKLSRKLWAMSPLYQWAVSLWTVYGSGESVTVTALDPSGAQLWAAFAKQQTLLKIDRVQDFSHNILVDGEAFLTYHADDSDGMTSVTSIDPDEITDVITHPNDKSKPMFYKRQYIGASGTTETLYYPDWEAYFTGMLDKPVGMGDGRTVADALEIPPDKRTDLIWSKRKVNPASAQFTTEGAIRPLILGEKGYVPIAAEAVSSTPGTVTIMQHVSWNRKDRNSLRGWPLSTVSGPWLHSHRKFMSDRLAVTAGKAAVIRRYQVQGGSQAVRAVQSTIASALSRYDLTDSNPPQTAGSSLVTNKAVTDFEDMPMITGAGDAKNDNEIFAWMGILGLGSFPHYFGLGDAYRLATATAMEKPLDLTYSAYRKFLAAQFERMALIVFMFNNLFGVTKVTDPTVNISTDRATTLDLINAASSIKALFADTLLPAVKEGVMPMSVATTVARSVVALLLDSLGASSELEHTDEEINDWIEAMTALDDETTDDDDSSVDDDEGDDSDSDSDDDEDVDEIDPQVIALAQNIANGTVSLGDLLDYMEDDE